MKELHHNCSFSNTECEYGFNRTVETNLNGSMEEHRIELKAVVQLGAMELVELDSFIDSVVARIQGQRLVGWTSADQRGFFIPFPPNSHEFLKALGIAMIVMFSLKGLKSVALSDQFASIELTRSAYDEYNTETIISCIDAFRS